MLNKMYDTSDGRADLIVPEVFSCVGTISTPFLMAFEMSNTARDIAHVMKIDASANSEPARQINVRTWNYSMKMRKDEVRVSAYLGIF